MEGPDATEVRDTFPGRELVTVEVAVAGEPSYFELDVELTKPVGLEEEMLVPGVVAARSTARTRCMSASHNCTVIQTRMACQ